MNPIPPLFIEGVGMEELTDYDIAAMDAAIDQENRNTEEEQSYSLPIHSELRKPWKEMNPLLAMEEAKLLPLPYVKRLSEEEAIERIIAKEYDLDSPEWNHMWESLTRPMFEPLTPEQEAIGLTRCPYCRNGFTKRKDRFLPCPCCCTFVFVPETRITGFSASLNETNEMQRIDRNMREIVKTKKKARKEKEDGTGAKAKKKAEAIDLFGHSETERAKAKEARKGKRADHA